MSKALKIIGMVAGVVAGVATLGLGIAAITPWVASAAWTTTALVGGGLAAVAGATGIATTNTSAGYSSSSPTYSFGPLQSQVSNQLRRPIMYGEVKVAGNTIWQEAYGSTLQRILCLGDGEVESISNVLFNDIAVSDLAGCSYTTYTGNGTQFIDSRVPGTTQEDKARVIGGMKYDAYLAITAQASNKIGGNFNVTADVKGKKIKVYTDLTNYTIKYSNNPAWCLYDFLTGYSSCGISPDEIDLQSFLDAAAYCDELVGGKPRFTLNIVLDVENSRLDWMNEMLACFRGYLSYQGGKVSLNVEKPEATMQVFTPDNILVGSEKFWTTPRENLYDVVKVQFVDPDNEYVRVFAQAEAEQFQNEQPIVQEIKTYGVTNFNQASRLAWYYLNQSITCNKFISFQTSKEGLDRTIGDVVEITSTFLGYVNKKMRIINISEAQEGQMEIVCQEYNEAIYSDTLGSAEPVYDIVNITNELNVDNVNNFVASQSLNLTQFNWEKVSGTSITYEIREGDSWATSSIVASDLIGTTNYTNIVGQGTFKFWIKAKNKYDMESDNATLSILVVDKKRDTNMVVDQDVLDEDLRGGRFVGCHAYNNVIKLNSYAVWESCLDTWGNSSNGYTTVEHKWAYPTVLNGIYTTPIYDVGVNSLCSVNFDHNFYKDDYSCSVLLEARFSEDGITWTSYEPMSIRMLKFRYYQGRVTINSPLNKFCSLNMFKIKIDIPDTDLYFGDQQITNAADGVTVYFDPAFVTVPTVVANVSDGAAGCCVVDSKSMSQATVKVYDNFSQKTLKACKVDIRVKGY